VKKRSRSARVQSARFRYSRLKEAATPTLWPMGFESSSVYRLLKTRALAERGRDRDSSISGHVFRSQPPSYRKTGGTATVRMWDGLDAAGLGPRASASGNTWAPSIRCRFIASTRSVRRSERLRSNGVPGCLDLRSSSLGRITANPYKCPPGFVSLHFLTGGTAAGQVVADSETGPLPPRYVVFEEESMSNTAGFDLQSQISTSPT
jgi:hypothetical protein